MVAGVCSSDCFPIHLPPNSGFFIQIKVPFTEMPKDLRESPVFARRWRPNAAEVTRSSWSSWMIYWKKNPWEWSKKSHVGCFPCALNCHMVAAGQRCSWVSPAVLTPQPPPLAKVMGVYWGSLLVPAGETGVRGVLGGKVSHPVLDALEILLYSAL